MVGAAGEKLSSDERKTLGRVTRANFSITDDIVLVRMPLPVITVT